MPNTCPVPARHFALDGKVPEWYRDGMEDIPPLKYFREQHDPPLSQEQLADLLGVTRETVTRWESGNRKVDPDRIAKVSKITGIPPAKIRPDLATLFVRGENAPS